MQAGEVKIINFPVNAPASSPSAPATPVVLTGATLSLTILNQTTGTEHTVVPSPSTTIIPVNVGGNVYNYPIGQVATYLTLNTDFPTSGWYSLQLKAFINGNANPLISPVTSIYVGAVQ